MSKHNVFVYGSLRKGCYNFNRFGGQKYVSTHVVEGFDLYDLGAYPCVTEGSNSLVVELHNIEDDAFQFIHRMELGAGYISKEIEIDGIKGIIYLYTEKPPKDYLVKFGDWLKHLAMRNDVFNKKK